MARRNEAYEIAALLFRVGEHMRHQFGSVATEFGLTAPQARALLRLGEPAPMRALADHLNCDASNVTGLADRLEAQGFVQRDVSAGDRRVKLLALTPKGRKLRSELERRVLETSPVMTDLSPRDRGVLKELLRTILEGDSAEAAV